MSWFADLDRQLAEIKGLLVDEDGNALLPQIKRRQSVIIEKLDRIEVRTKQMAVDTAALKGIVADLKAQAQKNSDDITAILAKLSGISSNDPAVQADIDAAVADLTAVRDGMVASDAAAEKA